LLHGAGNPQRLRGANTDWIVQEEGAQAIALLVGAKPGDSVLDACAGRGQKTLLLSEGGAVVDAADLHPRKLALLGASGAKVRAVYAVDWTRGSGEVSELYDRVLVDAPCSGVGTLRRRPEIAGRLAASDPSRLAAVQLAIARGAARHVRPGGRLIYAVCSVLREEAEGVAEALARELEPAPFDAPLDIEPRIEPAAHSLLLLPHLHGTDGYFIASFSRR
jgi:16S rRNA (cytosine967-C5)-methyltransferase